MAAWAAYGDESVRPRSYWLALTLVDVRDAASLGRLVRSLHLPGQRQLHFKSERDPRRRAIIKALVDSKAVHSWVYRAPRPVVPARESCLRAIVDDLVDNDAVSQLILDRVDDQQAARDRATISEALRKHGSPLRYQHASPWQHAGLQVADVVAWAYGAGGDWRRRVRPLVDRAVDLE